MPVLNAYIERFIQTIQTEGLDHFLVFGQEHFDYLVREFVRYYHHCRPHQGICNVLLPTSGGRPTILIQVPRRLGRQCE